MKAYLSGPFGPERGVVSLVEEDPAAQFSAFNHCPSSPTRGIQLVLPLPGKFDPLTVVRGFYPAVHFPLDQTELKMPRAVLIEREMPRNLHIREDVSLAWFNHLSLSVEFQSQGLYRY
jgi:hypothetical protein